MLPTYNELKFDARKQAIPFLTPAPPFLFRRRADSLYMVPIVYLSIISDDHDHRLICAWPSVLTIRDSIAVGLGQLID